MMRISSHPAVPFFQKPPVVQQRCLVLDVALIDQWFIVLTHAQLPIYFPYG